jgi:hypothetical protein
MILYAEQILSSFLKIYDDKCGGVNLGAQMPDVDQDSFLTWGSVKFPCNALPGF